MRGWHFHSYEHALASRGIKIKAVIIDIDGTIYNVDARLNHALKHNNYGSRRFWNEFMDPKKVHLDKPIPGVKSVLKSIPKDVKKIYVSGRRNNLIKSTKEIMERDGIPGGTVILRPKNYRSEQWKNFIFKKIKKNHQVLVGIGDTLEDINNYEKNYIPAVKVTMNKRWSDRIIKRIKRLVGK